ncbi:MAG: hypothetical protein MEQ74_00925 [Paracoccus sp.]|nr:hypothetical protein [Paracoccus sp. (in: a-proteobacteria)]
MNEMMAASSSVISARMTIMGKAAICPAKADYAEIGGMMQEKLVVLSQVQQALLQQWAMMFADTSKQAQHLGGLFVTGRPASASGLSNIAEALFAHGTRMMAQSMDASGLALAPVHHQATANAKRLSQ